MGLRAQDGRYQPYVAWFLCNLFSAKVTKIVGRSETFPARTKRLRMRANLSYLKWIWLKWKLAIPGTKGMMIV